MRQAPLSARGASRRLVWLVGIVVLAILLLLAWHLSERPSPTTPTLELLDGSDHADSAKPAAPPWRHGAADARFTLILYADMECPYCKAYLPHVMAWVEQHPDTRLQWHHLPLPAHEPAASQFASLAECAGEVGGSVAFWQTVTWIYLHTRSEGQGLPEEAHWPGHSAALQSCVDSGRALARVQTQAREASRDGILATPTLRMRDETTGQSLLLQGPVDGDALLSALDLLTVKEVPTETPDVSAIPDGDMPR